MVVDPGASLTCLSPEVAANLELNVADPLVVVQLSGIGNATAPVVALDALQVGPLVARGLAIAVLDLPEFLEVDGLLGLDFCDALGLTRLILELDTVALVLR
jgi:predicted aspartyl protease